MSLKTAACACVHGRIRDPGLFAPQTLSSRLSPASRGAINLARHIARLRGRELHVDRRNFGWVPRPPHRYLLAELLNVLCRLPPTHLQRRPKGARANVERGSPLLAFSGGYASK